MISPVDGFIEAFADSGADIITAHVEAGPHIHRTIQKIKSLGVKAGVAINPGTSLSSIEYILDMVDLVCVMTVNPGFGGQKFIHSQVEKVRILREIIGDREIHIEIDGGVDNNICKKHNSLGADVLVAGSYIFKSSDINNAIDSLK